MNGPLDYTRMVQQLGLLSNAAYDPITNKNKGMNPLANTEGARPYYGGSTRLYHGTDAPPFQRFDLNKAGSNAGTRLERGVFMSPDPKIAQEYGSRTIPLDVNLSNAARVDWSKISKGGYSPQLMQKAMDAARRHKKDFLIVDNVRDSNTGPATLQTQIIALNPAGKVKNALTGGTMFGGAFTLGDILSGALNRKEPLPPM